MQKIHQGRLLDEGFVAASIHRLKKNGRELLLIINKGFFFEARIPDYLIA